MGRIILRGREGLRLRRLGTIPTRERREAAVRWLIECGQRSDKGGQG